jgi:hypothetical protein
MNIKETTNNNQQAKKMDPLFLIGLVLSLIGFTISIIKLLKL